MGGERAFLLQKGEKKLPGPWEVDRDALWPRRRWTMAMHVANGGRATRRRACVAVLVPWWKVVRPKRCEASQSAPEDPEAVAEAVAVVFEARNVAGRLQKIAETPMDSEERKQLRSQLPAYLRRVRKLSKAVPVCAQLAYGEENAKPLASEEDASSTESYLKLGMPSVEVFDRVGKLVTWGGSLAPEVLNDPSVALDAKLALDRLLNDLPPEALEAGAQKFLERNGFPPGSIQA